MAEAPQTAQSTHLTPQLSPSSALDCKRKRGTAEGKWWARASGVPTKGGNTKCCRSSCAARLLLLAYRAICGSEPRVALKTRRRDRVTQELRLLQHLAICPAPPRTPLRGGTFPRLKSYVSPERSPSRILDASRFLPSPLRQLPHCGRACAEKGSLLGRRRTSHPLPLAALAEREVGGRGGGVDWSWAGPTVERAEQAGRTGFSLDALAAAREDGAQPLCAGVSTLARRCGRGGSEGSGRDLPGLRKRVCAAFP